jgi:hypothetical protein
MPAGVICPVDGARLVLVASTNASGDPIERWECPNDTWQGPWYSGEPSDASEALPELGRDKVAFTTLDSGSAAGGDGLTDAELRATPVPVSGTVTASGPLTDAQLRAAAVPVSAASLPLPAGAATEATLARRFGTGGRVTEAFSIVNPGDNTVLNPAPGLRLRVFWIGMSVASADEVVATMKFAAGGTARYIWNLGAFMHWETIEGAVDEDLIINLSSGVTTKVILTYETF